jgi:cell division transport system ATP-binding protein
MEGQAPYIQFDRVEVKYSDVVAGLRGVSLDVMKGEFIFLCGQTGSGKSTLLKCLTREARVTKGRVLLNGRDLASVTPKEIPLLRREMGIVPQDFGLLQGKTVWENVAYALRAVGRTRREIRKAVPEILDRVNILHRADALPSELSGGEQQRVAIGRALINNPPLLLADEPTGNLDPTHSIEIMQLLAELNMRGATVIVATHDMAVVERMGKRVVQMEFGRLAGEAQDA